MKENNGQLHKEIEALLEKRTKEQEVFSKIQKELTEKNHALEKLNAQINQMLFREKSNSGQVTQKLQEELEIKNIQILGQQRQIENLQQEMDQDKKYSKKLMDSQKEQF